MAGLFFVPGCKRAAAPEAASPPSAEQTPVSSPAPSPSKPSAIAQPPVEVSAPNPARIVYVATAFQAADEGGTHDFPVGAAVTVLSEEGDDYIVEYLGVSVRNNRSYFSETAVEKIAAAPAFAAPQLKLSEVAPPPPLAPPDAALLEEDRKNSERLEKIRELNDEIRTAQDKDEKAAVEKLKEQREKLSEELTKTAKP